MNPRERFLHALLGEPKDHTPATCVTQVGIVEVMDAIDAKWPETHFDSKKMAALGASLWNIAKIEVVRVPFDLTVMADALGAKVDPGKVNVQPMVKGHPFTSADQMKIPDDFLKRGRIPVVLEAVKILKEKYGSTLPVLAGFEAPFTLAGHLVGTETLLKWAIKSRDQVKEITKKTTEAAIMYAEALLKAGADVLSPCEPTASTNLISPKDFRELVKPYLTDLAKSIDGYFILHICGDATLIVKDMAETGMQGLSIEDKVDIRSAKQMAAGKSRICGNISTANTLIWGTPEQVKEEAKKALDAGVDLLCPSCGLAPITPLKNVKAIVTAVNEYYGLPG
ncbi:MAG: methylcobamide:CoM methyltransferase MtaA [Nitrososphaerales archaeon]